MRRLALLVLPCAFAACERDLSLPDAPSSAAEAPFEITGVELCSGYPADGAACVAAIGAGGEVRATVTVNLAATGCVLAAGGVELPCSANGGTELEWSCRGVIPGPIPDGLVRVEVRALRGETTARRGVDVPGDVTPPSLQLAGSSFLRVLGREQGLAELLDPACLPGDAAAAGDVVTLPATLPVDAGATYEGAGVAALELRGEGPRCARSWTIEPGPAGALVPLPGTAAASPQRLFFRAIDVVGNASAEQELVSAADVDGPVIDAALVEVRWEQGLAEVSALPAAFADASPVLLAELTPGSGPVVVGGSIVVLPVLAGGADPSLTVVDKCGNESAPLPIAGTRDTTPPSLDRSRLTVSRSRVRGTMEGAEFFARDAQNGPLEVRVRDAAGTILTIGVVDADGSFAPQLVGPGTSEADRAALVVEVEDRAGNVATTTAGRGVFELTVDGRLPYVEAQSFVQLVPFVADADPRLASPGLAYALAAEGDSLGAWGPDGNRLEVIATPSLDPAHETIEPLTPGARVGAGLAFDSVSSATYLFGGSPDASTWRWGNEGFTRLATVVAPPARFRHATSKLGSGGFLVFGGCPTGSADVCPGALGDTWLFDGTWRELAIAGPPPRIDAATSYRPDGLIWLYGGRDPTGAVLSDLWAWSPFDESWTELTPTVPWPGPRAGAMFAEHGGLNQGVLFGGFEPGVGLLDDTWHVPGFSVAFSEQAVAPPPARSSGGLVWDPHLARLWLVGGVGGGAGLWWYDSLGWQEAVAAAPWGPRDFPAVSYLASQQQLLVVGGSEAPGESWSFGAGLFALRASSPTRAASVLGAAWDPLRGGVLVGGDAGQFLVTPAGSNALAASPPGVPVFDAWRGRSYVIGADGGFELVAGAPQALAFPPGVTRPGAAVAFDPVRGETILFGGTDPACPSGFCGETWAFDGRTATQLALPNAPQPRRGAAFAFDATAGRLVLVGGEGLGAVRLSDVWELGSDAWYQLTLPGACVRPSAFSAADGSFHVACSDDAGNVQLYRRVGDDFVAEAPAALPAVSAAAFDAARGLTVFAGEGVHALTRTAPHARWPGLLARISLPEGTLAEARFTAVVAGLSELPPGPPPYGAELHVWSTQARAFVEVGANTAAPGDDATLRTITGALPAGELPRGRSLFVLLTTPAASGDVAGVDASLSLDDLYATVTLELP